MEKLRSNIRLSVVTITLILLFLLPLNAQKNATLYSLYKQNKYSTLKEKVMVLKGEITQAEYLFFTTLFIQDADQAYLNYEQIFQNASGAVKYYAGERLKHFYYAKGYYSTASNYQKYLADNHSLVDEQSVDDKKIEEYTPDSKDEKLYIQVGAFGIKENADQMKKMLDTQNVPSKIKQRVVGKNRLFCVWVIGKKEFKETLNLADELKRKYHLDYKIIKE